jgi:hypothetical protein
VARTYDGNALTFDTATGPTIRSAIEFDQSQLLRLFLHALMYGSPSSGDGRKDELSGAAEH